MTTDQLDDLTTAIVADLAHQAAQPNRHRYIAMCQDCGDEFVSAGRTICPACREWERHATTTCIGCGMVHKPRQNTLRSR